MVSSQDPKAEDFVFYLSCDISSQVGVPLYVSVTYQYSFIKRTLRGAAWPL